MENRTYIFIDGSRLFSCIYKIWKTKTGFDSKKLNIKRLVEVLANKWEASPGLKIFVVKIYLYFKKDDHRMNDMLDVPDILVPGMKDKWRIIECAEGSTTIPEEQIQKLDQKYQDEFRRSEKGLDIRLASDALMLVANKAANGIVFLINDRDYKPLLEVVSNLGGNVSLTNLDSANVPQKSILEYCDRYLCFDEELEYLFGLSDKITGGTEEEIKLKQV